MRRLAITLAVVLLASDAAAWGEVFRVDAKAFGYCDGIPSLRVGTRSPAPLWLRLDQQSMWTISLTPDFGAGDSAELLIDEFTGAERGGNVHVAGRVRFTKEGGKIDFNGLLYYDHRDGGWRRFKGYFNQTDIFGQGCRWAGTLRTGRRVN